MKKLNVILVALFLLGLPLTAGAMSHEKREHGKTHQDHAGMKMEAGMVMLGEETAEGVKAMAHLNDVKAAMAKIGMQETHHFMAAFVDAAGNQITEGTVALKIVDPDGKESAPVKLVGMDGHFGADIVLSAKGKYRFNVGTRLPDGQNRQYEFEYSIK